MRKRHSNYYQTTDGFGDKKRLSPLKIIIPIILGVSCLFIILGIVFIATSKKNDNDKASREDIKKTDTLKEEVASQNNDDGTNTDSVPVTEEESELIVPYLIEEEYTEELVKQLEDSGFYVSVKYSENRDVEKGCIISQDPVADSAYKKTAGPVKITLEVSSGYIEKIMKNYENSSKGTAVADLESDGFEVIVREIYDDHVMNGNVIRTSPAKGETVDGDTVTIYVSKGAEKTEAVIPKAVVGMSAKEAMAYLGSYGISAERCDGSEDEYSDVYTTGSVIRTVPDVGSTVNINDGKTKVKLIISKGSEPVEDTDEDEYGPTILGVKYISGVNHSVHFRKNPNENNDYYCDILVGTMVFYCGKVNDTYAMIEYNGDVGYVLNKHLSDYAPSTEKIMYIANVKNSVHFRKNPNENKDYYCDIPVGTQVTFIENVNSQYAKIRYNGNVGYVKREHLASYMP